MTREPGPGRRASPDGRADDAETLHEKVTTAAGRMVAWPLLGLVWVYRRVLSPLLGVNCRFQPGCSEYASEALRRYGGIEGGWLALKRLGRCHPWGGAGYDPVPRKGGDKTGTCQ
jgi:putative membrane protein insertion efficiency factor